MAFHFDDHVVIHAVNLLQLGARPLAPIMAPRIRSSAVSCCHKASICPQRVWGAATEPSSVKPSIAMSQANQHGSTARVDAERRHLQNSHCSPVSSPVKTGCICLHPPYLSGSLEQLKTEFHAAHPRKRRERPPFWAPNLVFPIRSAMDEAAVPLAVRVELLG